jgi:hypothetical protein
MITQDAFTKGRSLIVAILLKMDNIGVVQSKFISQILLLFLGIRGRVNFLQMSRFGEMNEQSYRNNFSKTFNWLDFNLKMIQEMCGDEIIIGFDPSYVSKSGKKTHGLGYFYSGCSGKYQRGLELGSFAAIDVKQNTAYHLVAKQTNYIKRSTVSEESLIDQYITQLEEVKEAFVVLSGILVVDAYFCKKKFIDACIKLGIECITRMRDDANLRYHFTGQVKKGKGRKQEYDGKVDLDKIDKRRFKYIGDQDNCRVYSAELNSVSLKRNLKIVYLEIIDEHGTVQGKKIFMSTNIERSGIEIIKYYKARYQMEFIFRDAKQHTGLEHCQARDKDKLDFHFNASMTAVNIAKQIARQGIDKNVSVPISISDIKIELSNKLMLDLFFLNYGIKPYLQKNNPAYYDLLNFGKKAA